MKDYIAAHQFSSNHRAALQQDNICGCFHCFAIFPPSQIAEWIQDISGTAICPFCGIDSIIGESSGYPITKEFLTTMRIYWFC